MPDTKPYAELGLLSSNNDQRTLDYYAQLEQFIGDAPGSNLLKFRNFSVFTPRQVVSDFLVRYELFKMIQNVPGDILEFGVFFGQGLFSYAQFSAILEPYHINREIIGFDTFEGFPETSEQDKTGNQELLRAGGLKADSYDTLQQAAKLFDMNRYLGHLPKVRLVKGDVTRTLDGFIAENPHVLIAMLYMDLDLYQPTREVLKKLYDRVPQGGIVAFDQLNHRAFPGETSAFLEVLGDRGCALKRLPFCSRISYFIKQ
ncbi:MAG: class I SAM-dependent methyltransferase [Nitrosomonadales bacterium]|nr:class I SAM-dependent methyltransferase [Nitrosomonadales bacterium]